jgi:hypothetical protein
MCGEANFIKLTTTLAITGSCHCEEFATQAISVRYSDTKIIVQE